MSLTPSVARTSLHFNKDHVSRAFADLQKRYGADARWSTAIRRAWQQLQLTGWAWNGTTLIAHSRRDGAVRHFASLDGCDCESGTFGRMCWHMAAVHGLTIAGHLATSGRN